MEWMARSPERRADPAEVLSGCRSVICLSYDYDSPAMRPEGEGSICLYAHGRDYHGILEEKLADLQELLSIFSEEAKAKGKQSFVSVNRAQAVLRVRFQEGAGDGAEEAA